MRLLALLILALIWTPPALARDLAGKFDYYVLALSWQPSWCQLTGDARDAPECRPGTGRGFTVHGLWPQYERGWPEYCRTDERDPSRRESAEMSEIIGSAGLAAHQWRKHGRCSGLSALRYFELTRAAAASIVIPEALSSGPAGARTTVAEIQHQMRAANPQLPADGFVVQCRSGLVTEIRICLTRDLRPRRCAADLRDRCRSQRIGMDPPR